MSWSRRTVLAAAALACALPCPAADDLTEVVERVSGALVIVRSESGEAGSGVLIDAEGHVATAAQNVRGGLTATVEIDGELFPARIKTAQFLADIALLEIMRPLGERAAGRAVALGDSDAIKLGQRVFVVGLTASGRPTLDLGHVAGRRTASILHGGLTTADLIESDAATREAHAGAPMFDTEGHLIGIVTGISSGSSAREGVGYAVASSSLKMLLQQRMPWAGVEALLIRGEMAALLNLPQESGLLVQEVVPGSPAARIFRGGSAAAVIAGHSVTLGGDIILEIGGVSVGEPDAGARIGTILDSARPGSTVPVVILRRGQRLELAFEIPQR
jgi:serine protease Do